MMSAGSAASGVTNLNRTGIRHTALPNFCKPLHSFCDHVAISIAFTFFSCILLAMSAVQHVIWLSKNWNCLALPQNCYASSIKMTCRTSSLSSFHYTWSIFWCSLFVIQGTYYSFCKKRDGFCLLWWEYVLILIIFIASLPEGFW